MGKKNRSKTGFRSEGNQLPTKDGITRQQNQNQQKPQRQSKLSPQKRNEVNQLVEKLLKVSSSVQASSKNLSKEWDIHLEIDKILSKIMSIEKEMMVPLPNRDQEAQDAFITWLESNGAQINGVGIANFPGYELGIQAKRDLAEGEMLIGIPRKLMMTVDSVQCSLLGPLLSGDTMVRHMPNVALALLLLVERFRKDKESHWLPYLNMLPTQYTTVLYFTPQQLQELRGSPALEPALKQCRNIGRQYAYFNKLFQNVSDPASDVLRDVFTYEQYRWAVSTVMTRQNFVPGVGSGMVNALIPMWDICNHSNGKLSTDFNLNADRSECMAWRDFNAGEQVFILYGARSNADLLVHNGFIYPGNEHDSVKLRLGISKSDTLQPLRTQLLAKLGLPTAADFTLRCGSEPVDERLLAFLRVFSMGQDHLNHWLQREQCTDLMYPDCALETEVEVKMWNFLLTRIKLLLSSYPTTLEADIELLKEHKTTMPICQQLLIQLRIAEKQILSSAMEYVQQRSKI
ncbi:SET domain containing 3 [Lycorma delicatula]|uniref:SET domain containing 3 n=1 Tax=Lycorma delicatula TaxID=130591 RepID=UPI003F51A7F7